MPEVIAPAPAPAPAPLSPAPSSATIIADDWKAGLPEDLRGAKAIQTLKTPADVVKKLIHAEALVGADKVAIPSAKATPEEWSAFYNAIGRPEAATGYELPTEGMPEGFAVPDDVKGKLFERAHKLGIPKQQLAGMVRWFAEHQQEQVAAVVAKAQEFRASSEKQLRTEFGRAYDESIQAARAAALRFGGEERRAENGQPTNDLLDALTDSGLGNDPRIVRALANVGKAIAQDEIVGLGRSRSFTMTPAEAKAEIAALKQNGEHQKALHDRGHPAHAAALDRERKLYELVYSTDSDSGGPFPKGLDVASR